MVDFVDLDWDRHMPFLELVSELFSARQPSATHCRPGLSKQLQEPEPILAEQVQSGKLKLVAAL